MNARTTIKLLAAVCLAEAAVIGFQIWEKQQAAPVSAAPAVSGSEAGASSPSKSSAPKAEEPAVVRAELVKQNEALTAELAEVKKELDVRKSEISFSYGSVRDSGRFVGMTFRKMFETAAAREANEAEARRVDNQINVLSLGPFIQDAEVIESDPGAFAQFQAPLISEVLGLPPERGAELEGMLSDLKTQSLKVEEGSGEWTGLNDTALKKITELIPESQRPALRPQLDFLQKYGVLMIPAYSILRAPTPTVAESVKADSGDTPLQPKP